MKTISESLDKVSLSENGNKNPEYTDITKRFFEATSNIKGENVLKSPHFSMFEGTHALEVSNSRLDTGLIKLTEDDLNFNTSDPQNLDDTLAIMNQLFCCVMSWLNNSNLSLNVLSCRYVDTLLVNYMKDPERGLDGCSFDTAAKPSFTRYGQDSFEYQLIHKVLRSFTISILLFLQFGITIGRAGVLFEEEDIHTNTMDLDILSSLSFIDVSELIISSMKLLQDYKKVEPTDSRSLKIEIMIKYFQLISNFLIFPTLLLKNVDLFEKFQHDPIDDSFIQDSIKILSELQKTTEVIDNLTVLPGSFSRYCQINFNNNTPPKNINIISTKESLSNACQMFNDLQNSLKIVSSNSINQFQSNLTNFSLKSPLNHVLVRGFFQLFLIRDDRSIMGSNISIAEYTKREMEMISCFDNTIFNMDDTISAENQSVINSKWIVFMTELETGNFHQFTLLTHNSSRQRQDLARSIVIWDTLQVNSEQLEIDLINYGIDDKFINVEQSQMPISSYVYYKKLTMMLEVALRGFELELYKPFEMYQMFWYSSYITEIIIRHLERLVMINNTKIDSIGNMNKKIKKLKAGPKKQSLKQKYQTKQITEPFLQEIESNLMLKAIETSALRNLLEAHKLYILVLMSLNVIQNPKNQRVSSEMLYNLRMKPWSSVGVPELPTFATYQKSIDNMLPNKSKTTTKEIIQILNYSMSFAKESKTEYLKIIQEYKLSIDSQDWYKTMIKSCIVIIINCTAIIKNLNENGDYANYKIKIETGGNRYFPNVVPVDMESE